ncbi:MAG: hypothetical protein ACT4PM_04715 [Gemmatimonadales bacterium]
MKKLWAVTGVLVLLACPPTKTIKELLDDPGRYDGETVRIVGEVKGSVGGLGFGAYQVDDGTGTLTVVTDQGGATPRTGARVAVEGEFESAFTLGDRTLAVLQEKKRRSP